MGRRPKSYVFDMCENSNGNGEEVVGYIKVSLSEESLKHMWNYKPLE